MSGLDANGRVDKALRLLAPALQPVIERELRRVYRAKLAAKPERRPRLRYIAAARRLRRAQDHDR
jgi:hypothetical protein